LSGALHFARLIILVGTTTSSIILSSNKIQNEDILVSANPDPPGKWPLKRTKKDDGDSGDSWSYDVQSYSQIII